MVRELAEYQPDRIEAVLRGGPLDIVSLAETLGLATKGEKTRLRVTLNRGKGRRFIQLPAQGDLDGPDARVSGGVSTGVQGRNIPHWALAVDLHDTRDDTPQMGVS